MPVGEVRVGGGGKPLGVRRVADIQQQSVTLAGTSAETDAGIERDIVALGRSAAAVRLGARRTRRRGRAAPGATPRCRRPSVLHFRREP